ncbi:HAD hydrolase family protein [Streptococcus sp. S784/96/1]|uniref:HAD hydrolase family protein n=1 Tax=Streptococcus sp. S784/96/1 TaxID=2653499 RepID=UPI0013895E8A|nr:HAD hydrolase family protein [Streptococcus sp. S784/96/1]
MHFVFDLDGTLSFDGETIADELKSALGMAAQHGHQIIFASARSYRDCIGVLGQELAQELVIGLNGGLAYKEGELIYHRQLDKVAYQEVLSWCHRYNLPFFVDDDFNYASQEMERIPFARYVDPLELATRVSVEELSHPIKVVIEMSRHEDLVEDMCRDLETLECLDISYHEEEKCLYINPYETTKVTAVTDLIGKDFIAFGNDKNDMALFKASLYGVQVGYYSPLMTYADVILPADSSAIAQKLKELYQQF